MSSTRERRWYQFSLRTMFVATTAVAICLFLWERGVDPLDGLMIAAPIIVWYIWRKHIHSESPAILSQFAPHSAAAGRQMRTKRQPTIRTLLLLMAVVAVQCAAQAEYIEFVMSNGEDAPIVIFSCLSLVSGLFVWALMPLFIGLWFRSALLMSGVCCAFGCIFSVMDLWLWPYLLSTGLTSLSQNVVGGCGGLIYGPLTCLDRVAHLSGLIQTMYGRTMMQEIALRCGWLLVYTTTCFFIAKSCRLREQPT